MNGKTKSDSLKDVFLPYLLLSPAFLLIALFLVYPSVFQVYLSVFTTTLYDKGVFAGLTNYFDVITDPVIIQAAKNTGAFVLLATTLELLWGLILALALNTVKRGKDVLRGLVLIPLMLTPVAVGSIWNFMFFPEGGGINTLFRFLGFSSQLWLTDPKKALLAIVGVEIWQYIPFSTLVILAGLQSIPSELYEAASIDGASKARMFGYITLPLLKDTLLLSALFNFMRQIKAFDIIYTVTKGGPGRATSVISFDIYQTAFRYFNISKAAATSLLVLVFVLVISNAVVKKAQARD